VLLPRVAEDKPPVAAGAPELEGNPKGRGETILVVEDDTAVRSVVADILRRDGYHVLAVADPSEALQLAREREQGIDLLVTDIIMPGMNGRELRDELTRRRPALPALFVSGYSEDVVSEQGALDEDVALLHKPFSVDELRERVRAVLGPAGAKGPAA
jgi:CheY-like chemotaxis protein